MCGRLHHPTCTAGWTKAASLARQGHQPAYCTKGRDDRAGFCPCARARDRNHSRSYGGGSTCAHTGKRPARARPARFVARRKAEKRNRGERNQKTFVNSTSGLVQYAGQVLVTAGIALDARKPVFEQAALQVVVELPLDAMRQGCAFGLQPGKQLRAAGLDDAIERRLFRSVAFVDAASSIAGSTHSGARRLKAPCQVLPCQTIMAPGSASTAAVLVMPRTAHLEVL